MKNKIETYFKISNLIEDVFDSEETEIATKIFRSSLKSGKELKNVMYFFHNLLGHLNDYCKAGELRNYPVFVGGIESLDHTRIECELEKLFEVDPKTLDDIKKWHISFEEIHPFGDGNGRVGRMLMLLQLKRNKIDIPEIFLDEKNFDSNRIKYYKWFK